MYCVKWVGFPHSRNCDGEVDDPAELLVVNGKEIEGRKINIMYNSTASARWCTGAISKFNAESRKHEILYDMDSERSELDLVKPQKEWKLIGLSD